MMEPFGSVDDQTIAPVPDRLDVVSIGLMLCPNRNLTTLTAAVLSLHPHVQVLNHGFERLEAAGLLRFLRSGSNDDLEAFLRGAIGFSGYGRVGDYGGNILLSHAYKRPTLARRLCATLCGRAGQVVHPLPGLEGWRPVAGVFAGQ